MKDLEIRSCRPIPGGVSLKVRLPTFGLILHDLHLKPVEGAVRLHVPRRPLLDVKGRLRHGNDGAVLDVPAVGFDQRESATRFNDAVLDAMQIAFPADLAALQATAAESLSDEPADPAQL